MFVGVSPLEFVGRHITWIGLVIVVLGLLTGWRDLLRLSPRRIWAISSVCFAESVRRRVLWITPLAILGVVAIAQLQHPLDEQDAIRQAVKICVFAAGLVVTVTAIILACTNLPKEIESRVIYTIVTKPTTRLEIVLGKVLGFARVSALILLIMGLFSWGYLHARALNLQAAVRERLEAEPPGSPARQTLEHYAEAGLLDTRAMERPGDVQVFGRPPTAEPLRWMAGGQGHYYVASFALTDADKQMIRDAANRGAGVYLFNDLRYEHRTPTPEELESIQQMRLPLEGVDERALGPAAPAEGPVRPLPQVKVEVRDRDRNVLFDPSLLNKGQAITVPPPGSPTPAILSLMPEPDRLPEVLDRLLEVGEFSVVVTASTPAVDYAVGPAPSKLVVVERDGSLGGSVSPLPTPGSPHPEFPHFESSPGRYGMQVAGKPDDKGPVAVFDFSGADVGAAGGDVTLELKTGVENSADAANDTEAENLPLVSLKVRDPKTGNVSEPFLVRPEINRVAYVPVPRAALPGADFQVLLHARTPGIWVGVRADSSLALATADRSFAVNLLKSLLVLWLLAVLVVAISIFCSTFLSWPIAVVLTLVMLFGRWGVQQIGDVGGADLGAQITGDVRDPVKAAALRTTANALSAVLKAVAVVMPDVSQFSATEHIARGVSIPAPVILDALRVLFGYGLPLVVLSYVILRAKEVAP